jgi:hypothetical protein
MLPMCAFRDSGSSRKKVTAAPLLLVAILCAYPLAAWSQTLPEEALEQVVTPPARNWDITLGTGIAESPIYPGAKPTNSIWKLGPKSISAMGDMRGLGSGYRTANRLTRLFRLLILAAV